MQPDCEIFGFYIAKKICRVQVAAFNIFEKFCTLIGRKDLISDSRFDLNVNRVKHAKILKAEIEKALTSKGAQAWAELLGQNGVPADRVALPEELFTDKQAEAMKVLLPYPDSESQVSRIPGLPIRFNGQRPPIRKSAPHRDAPKSP